MMKTRDLQHLAAAMAHEVRNPLNSMAIHIELLEGRLRKETLSAQDRESLLKSSMVMAGEIERIDKILEEYLEHAGPEEAARRPIDAAQLIGDAVKRVRAFAEPRKVGIEIKPTGELGIWTVDIEALAEALDAVLCNAVEASPPGALVEISARSIDDHAEVVVRDQGEGIAKEDLGRIFQLGFSKHGRRGLGLTVAKQIVKGHGGSLNGQSPGVGQGATFSLRMPLENDGDGDDD